MKGVGWTMTPRVWGAIAFGKGQVISFSMATPHPLGEMGPEMDRNREEALSQICDENVDRLGPCAEGNLHNKCLVWFEVDSHWLDLSCLLIRVKCEDGMVLCLCEGERGCGLKLGTRSKVETF